MQRPPMIRIDTPMRELNDEIIEARNYTAMKRVAYKKGSPPSNTVQKTDVLK